MTSLTFPVSTASTSTETKTPIRFASDIATARLKGRALARDLGFSDVDSTLISAALAEIARNIVDHATAGEVAIDVVAKNGVRGIRIIARDEGPGIADVERAVRYGYATRRGVGMGLPGAKWLMDEFKVVSAMGRGTVVTMIKWAPSIGAHACAA